MWFSRSTILINFCSLLTYHPRSYYWHTYVAFYIKSLMFIIGCSETEENDFLSPVLAFSASTPCSLVSSTVFRRTILAPNTDHNYTAKGLILPLCGQYTVFIQMLSFNGLTEKHPDSKDSRNFLQVPQTFCFVVRFLM